MSTFNDLTRLHDMGINFEFLFYIIKEEQYKMAAVFTSLRRCDTWTLTERMGRKYNHHG
jgi:hypothetical protein